DVWTVPTSFRSRSNTRPRNWRATASPAKLAPTMTTSKSGTAIRRTAYRETDARFPKLWRQCAIGRGRACSSGPPLAQRGSGRAFVVTRDPEETGGRDDEPERTRQLSDPKATQPEAVHPDRFDQEPAHRVEADVAEEERARPLAQRRAQPENQDEEHP